MRFDRHYKPELCVSKDETRFYLCHVECDVGAKKLVATDGHCLVAVPCEPEPSDFGGAVPTEALTSARKLAKKQKTKASVELLKEKAVTRDGLNTSEHARSVRDFCPWEQVLPAKRPFTVSFNAHLLSRLAEAIGAQDGVIVIAIGDPLDPLEVRTATGKEGVVNDQEADPIGILMPCRFTERK